MLRTCFAGDIPILLVAAQPRWAIVIFQWQIDLILFSCSKRRLRQVYAFGGQFLKRNPLPLKDFYVLQGDSVDIAGKTTNRHAALR